MGSLNSIGLLNLSDMIGHDEKAKYKNGMLGEMLPTPALMNLKAPYVSGDYILDVHPGQKYTFPAGIRFERLYIGNGHGKFSAKEADLKIEDMTYLDHFTINDQKLKQILIINSVFNKGININGLI